MNYSDKWLEHAALSGADYAAYIRRVLAVEQTIYRQDGYALAVPTEDKISLREFVDRYLDWQVDLQTVGFSPSRDFVAQLDADTKLIFRQPEVGLLIDLE